jgi:hypothetical protein
MRLQRKSSGGGFRISEGWASKRKRARNIKKGKMIKEKGFLTFEKQQTNEFKCKFEFTHSKTMYQRVCNIKLL